jgi:hypothetical protein
MRKGRAMLDRRGFLIGGAAATGSAFLRGAKRVAEDWFRRVDGKLRYFVVKVKD